MLRKATDMHLINDSAVETTPQWGIAFPIVAGWIDHHALHGASRIVAGQLGSLTAVIAGGSHAAPVGIKQQLGGIETAPIGWLKGALVTIAIDLTWLHA